MKGRLSIGFRVRNGGGGSIGDGHRGRLMPFEVSDRSYYEREIAKQIRHAEPGAAYNGPVPIIHPDGTITDLEDDLPQIEIDATDDPGQVTPVIFGVARRAMNAYQKRKMIESAGLKIKPAVGLELHSAMDRVYRHLAEPFKRHFPAGVATITGGNSDHPSHRGTATRGPWPSLHREGKAIDIGTKPDRTGVTDHQQRRDLMVDLANDYNRALNSKVFAPNKRNYAIIVEYYDDPANDHIHIEYRPSKAKPEVRILDRRSSVKKSSTLVHDLTTEPFLNKLLDALPIGPYHTYVTAKVDRSSLPDQGSRVNVIIEYRVTDSPYKVPEGRPTPTYPQVVRKIKIDEYANLLITADDFIEAAHENAAASVRVFTFLSDVTSTILKSDYKKGKKKSSVRDRLSEARETFRETISYFSNTDTTVG